MLTARSTTTVTACRVRPRGFTLTELVVTVAIMGTLIAMSAPRFGRSLEQSRADFAVANLRAVWAAQRLYWLENHVYAADTATLNTSKLLDPAIVSTTGDYLYTIGPANSSTFQAQAARASGTSWTGTFTIDETGTTAGKISASGQTDITPGFQ
jgi:prepilin-type N-terminal cleavage/methylation domain-containing protein